MFDDLERSLTQISRSCQYLTPNNVSNGKDRHKFRPTKDNY